MPIFVFRTAGTWTSDRITIRRAVSWSGPIHFPCALGVHTRANNPCPRLLFACPRRVHFPCASRVQHMIYFWNIQMQLQYTSEDRWNTWNIHLKHLQKHLKTIVKHRQHPNKTLATYMWNICNILINTFATYVWKTNETLGTYSCNIHVQPL
jgi:hypothetical protein